MLRTLAESTCTKAATTHILEARCALRLEALKQWTLAALGYGRLKNWQTGTERSLEASSNLGEGL